jgi:GNAT superfamily N-acetyltransferase
MLQSRTTVRVRKGVARDSAVLAKLFRQSWELAYRGIIPHLQLEKIIRQRDQSWWNDAASKSGLLVLEVGGKVAGYATFGRARGRSVKYQGEIYELYIEPTHQGLGFGEHLFEAARYSLDQRSLNGLIVWALADNEAAQQFYWRRGGRPVAKTTDKTAGIKLGKVAYGWN